MNIGSGLCSDDMRLAPTGEARANNTRGRRVSLAAAGTPQRSATSQPEHTPLNMLMGTYTDTPLTRDSFSLHVLHARHGNRPCDHNG